MPDSDISTNPIAIDMDVDPFVNIDMDIDSGGSGTNNYNALINKPKIEGVPLVGDKLLTEFGEKTLTNMEIKTIFDKVFRKD